MTINILFSASSESWEKYKQPLRTELDKLEIECQLGPNFSPEVVDYIIYAPNSELAEFSPFIRCKAVLNLWAGVENITGNTTLNIPLARMVDYGLTQGMVEWVVGHVMRHHLGTDLQINSQDGIWRPHVPPLAEDRIITFLGLGVLGTSSGQALRQLGFKVRGWSRRKKSVDGITCYHGNDGLKYALSGADFVVLLLPNTPETENTLPETHRFWSHPKITVTSHIAAATRPAYSAPVIVENIRRGENGESFLNLVDRQSGY